MSLHAFACFCRMEGEWAWWISARALLVSVLERPDQAGILPYRPRLDSTACPPGGECYCQVLARCLPVLLFPRQKPRDEGKA